MIQFGSTNHGRQERCERVTTLLVRGIWVPKRPWTIRVNWMSCLEMRKDNMAGETGCLGWG